MKPKGTTLCIIMTYNRQHLLHHAIDQACKQKEPVDIVIWNNGPRPRIDVPLFNEIQVFHGINSVGLHQRFVPALLYPHEYVMFLDDDLVIGSRFLANALSIIDAHESAMVVSMGSVIENPLSQYNIRTRKPIVGNTIRNSTPWHLDLGSMGICVCRRKYIHSVFMNGFIPPHPAEEIAFSMMHKIYNKGEIILAPHSKEDEMGIISFKQEHYSGLTSSPSFSKERGNIIQSLGNKLKWEPTAQNYPEWKFGEAFEYANR